MEKRPVVYKRRSRKPLSDLPSNAPKVHDDPGSPLSLPKSADGDGTKSIIVAKKTRMSWVDRSLSNRGRRSSLSWGEEFNLSDIAYKWVGTLFGSNDKKQGKKLERNLRDQPIKKPAVVNRSKRVNPPVEFVKEKRAMFAEIDSFELESEEESPASKPRPHEWIKEHLDVSDEVFPRKGALEIVPEVEFEEFADCLSAALRTPHVVSSQAQEEFSSVREDEGVLSLDCNLLVSELRSLQIEEDFRVSGELPNLNSLVEDDEEESSEDTKSEGSQCIEIFRQSGEILSETRPEELLPVFGALLEECQQTRPLSLREAISDFCDLAEMVKVGEGTFGEAFKGGGCVFKIVPMDGDFLVNAEVQKTSAEIYSEVLLSNTLDRLRDLDLHDSTKCANHCRNFIETKAIRICQGSYEVELCLAWEQWDTNRTSDNDHPMLFPEHQLYVVFVLADGGKDLENFVLSDFNETRSLLLQVVLALGVAEAGCGFEHRDLHWGNIVLARDKEYNCGHYRLLDEDLRAKTSGLCVSIIDFTLSRIDTGNHVFFCNLSADPALFEGPSRDTQADTYRRMLNLTKGNWEGSFPQTNCYWIHYLADILLKKKSYHCSSQDKRALRSFCKRVLLYESAKAAVSDDFFCDLWIKSSE